jgi:flagellar hook-basal body complex protein FliE
MTGNGIVSASGVSSALSQSRKIDNAGDQSVETRTPFAGLLKSMMDQTAKLDQQASATVSGLLNGDGVDIHQAMIATQKANIAFELALQVRNKAVGAYQQMMNMQF